MIYEIKQSEKKKIRTFCIIRFQAAHQSRLWSKCIYSWRQPVPAASRAALPPRTLPAQSSRVSPHHYPWSKIGSMKIQKSPIHLPVEPYPIPASPSSSGLAASSTPSPLLQPLPELLLDRDESPISIFAPCSKRSDSKVEITQKQTASQLIRSRKAKSATA